MRLDKWIAGIFLMSFLLGSPWAIADKLDTLETYPPVEYCKVTTDMFMSGADAAVLGHPKEVITIPPEAKDTLTERELDFVEQVFGEGYDAAMKLKEVKPELTMSDRDMVSQTYFEGCLATRSAKKNVNSELWNPGRMQRAASSQKLACETRARNVFIRCMTRND